MHAHLVHLSCQTLLPKPAALPRLSVSECRPLFRLPFIVDPYAPVPLRTQEVQSVRTAQSKEVHSVRATQRKIATLVRSA